MKKEFKITLNHIIVVVAMVAAVFIGKWMFSYSQAEQIETPELEYVYQLPLKYGGEVISYGYYTNDAGVIIQRVEYESGMTIEWDAERNTVFSNKDLAVPTPQPNPPVQPDINDRTPVEK